MNTQVNITRTWWRPKTMEVWDVDNTIQARKFSSQLNGIGNICKIISLVGSIFLLSTMANIGFTAFVLSTTSVLLSITTIALYCLGTFLKNLAQNHVEGLTPEHLHTMSVTKLVESFKHIDTYQTETELQNAITEKKQNFFKEARDAIEQTNGLKKLITPLYDPKVDLQPRFLIYTETLTDDEIYGLLERAQERGIILEFSQLFFYAKTHKKELTVHTRVAEDFDEDCAKALIRSFNIQVEFLVQRFKSGKMDLPLVQKQLNAFGFRWEDRKGVRALRPNIEIPQRDTLVIRGNCSEIGSPTTAVLLLAPYVTTIKMPSFGIKDLHFSEEYNNENRSFKLNNPADLNNYKNLLQELSSNKMQFDFSATEESEFHKIWQDTPPSEPTQYSTKL